MSKSNKVRVGIIGVGNCAQALVLGVHHYKTLADEGVAPSEMAGLMFPEVGPYLAGDIEFAAAWDVDAEKVGKDLSDAIHAGQNLDVGLSVKSVGHLDCEVLRGPTLDGAGTKYLEKMVLAEDWSNFTGDEVVEQVKAAGVDVLLNYLPVGSQEATEWWATVAIKAGVGFVNNIPVFIARNDRWRAAFKEAGLPLIGDDIKSQLGATYVHRVLARAFHDRGITLDRTYQLNVGGNMDFYNMLERSRLESKKISKASAVTDAYEHPIHPDNVHIGPSDYVKFLGDTKIAFIRCEGTGFGGAPIRFEAQLEVPDSPNSAGVVIDAARIAKLAMDRGQVDVDAHASAWLFKAPPREVAQDSDQQAYANIQTWLAEGDA